jgi:recombinational DNA repair protein (RecF pathway)
MLKHKRENRIIHVLHCWRCHSYTGPNHHELRNGGAVCGHCQDRNPLGNMVRLPVILVTQPITIHVAFTRSGKAAHGLHNDLKRALGSWVTFASGEVLERALLYLGMTWEQLAEHQDTMRRWGQGSSRLTVQPNRRNLLRLDYAKL